MKSFLKKRAAACQFGDRKQVEIDDCEICDGPQDQVVIPTLFVDGVRTLTVPAGDTSWDLITPGYHTFRAETLGGSHYVTRSGYISRPVTWTITD
jgi:hypothetical protein